MSFRALFEQGNAGVQGEERGVKTAAPPMQADYEPSFRLSPQVVSPQSDLALHAPKHWAVRRGADLEVLDGLETLLVLVGVGAVFVFQGLVRGLELRLQVFHLFKKRDFN